MKLLLKLAWRNVLRNKRRTVLAGLAVGIALASMIFIDGLYIGMLESMIRTATDTFLGQGQIHAEGFRDTLEVEKTIHNPEELMKSLDSEEILAGFSERTVSIAMLSSAAGVNSVVLYGINPERERRISMIDEAIKKGDYIASDNAGQILIGSKIAEILEVGTGDRLVLTTAQAGTGELSQDLFRVTGIFHMDIRKMDSGMAFINIDRSRDLLALGQGIHEIALKFKNIDDSGDRSLAFWRKYSTDGNEAIGWRDLIPQLDGIIDMTKISTVITSFLVFCIVAVIIMHALFMSLYERMFEFGILRALGTRPVNMALIIFFESAALSLISIVMGLGLAFVFMQVFSVYGINYKGIEFAGVTITELMYPVMTVKQFTLYPFLIFIFSLVAAIYPAVFAAKMTPARAMRRSM
ncbi:MAG TPA: ABC transporter permease [Nitrospirae bacterium]|nr:lipoprotein-releasing system transmembrane protein LolE [bacterium BMS3Abin10]GBE38525.1 lipoprotein-releasing system transmembrane protein LolE [bacterium BMS3Bbin08]HDH50168.1 ABC transporter permease [Nitrospirota bacterium]HDO25491.1 ABC transporter permease [Nitrospirota bacterium]HDZ83794.1 ABC transporter permease [Nitrospirota bacterium]